MNPIKALAAGLLAGLSIENRIETTEYRRGSGGAKKRSARMRERFAGVGGNWERAAGAGRMRRG